MKRLYLELYLALVGIFMFTLVSYVTIDDWLSPDLDLVAHSQQIQSTLELLEFIADQQGIEIAQEKLQSMIEANWLLIEPLSKDSPLLTPQVKEQLANHHVYSNDDDGSIFIFEPTDTIYHIYRDPEAEIWIALDIEDWAIFLVLMGCFAVYSMLMMKLFMWRFKHLEQVTQALAKGDLSIRAKETGSMKLGTLNRSFNAMADKISQLIESHKMLTNAIAHEVRTPLFRIQCQLDMLQEIPEQKDKYIAGIEDDIHELEEMINELLRLGKMETTPLTFISLDLAQWLPTQIEKWQIESPVPIELQAPQHWPIPLVDSNLFNRAISNVVRNASRYAKSQVRLNISSDDQNWKITIEDDGPGIPEAHWPHIFKPFYRVGSARDKTSGGFGLGLAIAEQIARQHHGHLVVTSSQSLGGACFEFTLPSNGNVKSA
ncbi:MULTISPECIES: ATP-binding protein [unclassified Vibrio]|uniref:ATP-binding protein n=3 Tax=Vibrio TaxID=662 RepID=UPI00148328F4|nr:MULTISPECIES: ATP-binding protein [unclassified Vibrio]NNN43651.1 HAMP domain-containing protein [Vibrio sp. 1-1(7)]NNN71475.1 HAMP domain-containing protein [Vibrio sp. 12-2(3-a)]